MTYTEDQLKAALVRALPEKLESERRLDGNGVRALARPLRIAFVWKENGREVTPYEWPEIVGMVEDELYPSEHASFRIAIWSLTGRSDDTYSDGTDKQRRAFVSAKWQTRAAALADIDAIKVEAAQ